MQDNKTIIALSSPAGEGGILVIRLSGKDSLKIAKLFVSIKQKNIKEFIPNYMTLCQVKTDKITDEVLCVYFKAPNSYTGEDVFEIHCHGNMVIAREIINYALENGCNEASPGEFTKRAYLNQKIDLTKAEGIIDIINAQNVSAINSAYNFIEGKLFKKITEIQKKVINLTAHAEVTIDYPEEDEEEKTAKEIEKEAKIIKNDLQALKDSYNGGRILKDGVRVAIIGEPNTGKSSLLNAILEQDRAIVTDIAGTTRDTIEESYSYKGIRFIFVDTAGIRDNAEQIEEIGIKKSKEEIISSDIILALSEYDKNFKIKVEDNKQVIYVKNKIDKIKDFNDSKLEKNKDIVYISAKTGDNLDKLKELLYNKTVSKISTSGVNINNQRQYKSVLLAIESIYNVLEALNNNITMDCIISDLNSCYHALGQITGVVTSEAILDEIFSRFCVGK